MTDAASKNVELTESSVRRRSGKKIAIIVIVTLLVTLFGVWVVLNVVLDGKIAAELSAYSAAGQPTKFYEFNSTDIANTENAAIPLKKAADVLQHGGYFVNEVVDRYYYPGFIKGNRSLVDDVIRKNSAACEFIIEARSMPQASVGHKWRDFELDLHQALPVCSHYLKTGRFSAICAVESSLNGKAIDAMENVQDIQNCIRCVNSTYDYMSFLAQIHLEAVLSQTMEEGSWSRCAPKSETFGRYRCRFCEKHC